jgi:tetrahydromethanopterin S-methyltransferase subunit G
VTHANISYFKRIQRSTGRDVGYLYLMVAIESMDMKEINLSVKMLSKDVPEIGT